jgi:predicted protein tyrosine phosphatase
MLPTSPRLAQRLSLRRVLFIGQQRAEAMRPPRRTVLISITDPNRSDAALGPGWADVLRLKFDDVDSVTFPGQDRHLQEITADQVAEIAAFVSAHASSAQRLVVHCRHGVSRSAAVARAVAQALGLSFPADYDGYNRLVYLALRRVVRHALAAG